MSERIEYSATGLDLAAMLKAVRRLETYFQASWVAGEGAEHTAYLEFKGSLPDFDAGDWPELVNLTVRGHLPEKNDPMPVFRDLLEGLSAAADSDVRAIVSMGFEEKSSKQNKRAYDMFNAELCSDYGRLCYAANGSRISDDPGYASEAFGHMAQELDVPMIVEKTDIGFTLKHLDPGGEIRLTGGFADNNPEGFWCNTGASVDRLLSAVEKSRDVISSGKIIAVDWFLGPRLELGPAPGAAACAKVIDLLARLAPQAKSYSFTVRYRLSELGKLEALRKLCGKDDEIFTSVIDFEQADGGLGNLRVQTTADGYNLLLSLAEPVDIEDIENNTTVRFETADA